MGVLTRLDTTCDLVARREREAERSRTLVPMVVLVPDDAQEYRAETILVRITGVIVGGHAADSNTAAWQKVRVC